VISNNFCFSEKKKMRKLITITILIFIATNFRSLGCSTAVISGKATPDGRPLLWKHRDTWSLTNKIVQFFDGKYACVGLVNAVDTINESIWVGFNSEGFAIMNSASYNLNNDTVSLNGFEGKLIKQALQNCNTVDDFEKFITEMEKPTRLEGNFGVIDAFGGAAYFELGNFTFKKYDANNPADAPNGYLIRTNYSFSGDTAGGGGYIRYMTINEAFEEALSNHQLDYCSIMQNGSRSLKHSLLDIDLNVYSSVPENTPTLVFFNDYVPRNSTATSCIVQGVKPDENPLLCTMWSAVGFPMTAITVPVWLNKDVDLPMIVQYDDSLKDSPISNYSLKIKDNVFAYKLGIDSKNYIDVNQLINANGSGFLQKMIPFEKQVFQKSEEYLLDWRKANGIENNQMKELYSWMSEEVEMFYFTVLKSDLHE
jgi:hypothetical protein